jgi:hypothetical protein
VVFMRLIMWQIKAMSARTSGSFKVTYEVAYEIYFEAFRPNLK